MTRFFYDLEFLEDGTTIELISIGIVSEGGDREYYAVNSDMPVDQIKGHSWLMKNVWPHLPLRGHERGPKYVGDGKHEVGLIRPGVLDTGDVRVKPGWVIANEVREFFAYGLDARQRAGETPSGIELWANFGAYDHLGLMQLWGPMINRPKFLPMFTHDLQQMASLIGVDGKDFPIEPENAHDALADARWNERAYDWLSEQLESWLERYREASQA